MGAQLNIRSEDAYRPASRLSELTGDSQRLAETIASVPGARMPAPTWFEAAPTIDARGDGLFGRGQHSARLNFGDCMVYGVAKVEREPLLFKGNNVTQTDIEPALQD